MATAPRYLSGRLVQRFAPADALRSKLQRNGYAPRIETGIQNGTFMLNVLVDVYTMTPNTLPELEKIAGKPPVLRKSSTDTPKVSPKAF